MLPESRTADLDYFGDLLTLRNQRPDWNDIEKYASRHIKATKCALSLRGISDDFMAEPFHRFKGPERARVAAILAEFDRLES